MKVKAYCLRPTIRLNKKQREQCGLKLGYKAFAEIDGWRVNCRVLGGYKGDILWIGFPKFDGKKGIKIIKKGKVVLEGTAMYDNGTPSMKKYSNWYNENRENDVIVTTLKKIKHSDTYYFGTEDDTPYLIEKEIAKKLGKNAGNVMPKEGIYLPHSTWARLKIADGQEVELLSDSERFKIIQKNLKEKMKEAKIEIEEGVPVEEKDIIDEILAEDEDVLADDFWVDENLEIDKILDEFEEAEPQDTNEWVGKARENIRAEDAEGTVKCLKEAIEMDPKNDEAYALLGTTYRFLKKYDDAISSFKQALEYAEDAKKFGIWLLLGETYLDKEKPDKDDFKNALDCAEKVTKCKDESIEVKGIILKARVYDERGDSMAALFELTALKAKDFDVSDEIARIKKKTILNK